MIHVVEFAFVVIVISASGVMSPGPLFAANISHGLRDGAKSGIKMAVGHTIVEFPLVVLLGIGALSLETFPEFRMLISILGAITLFVFAFTQIRTVLKGGKNIISKPKQHPILTGIAFSALNPFFIIWWLTIGLKLITDAMLIWAFAGMLIVFVMHIWMDFVWLGGIAFLASKSKQIMSNRNYKALMIGLNIMLIYFGITFLLDAAS
jgi:threonine/homoserine/homoserine lactone efflux protein